MPDWGILGVVGVAVVTAVWWAVRHTVESYQRSKDLFRERRLEAYRGILDPMLAEFAKTKQGRRGRKGIGMTEDQLRRAMFDIKIMATDEVVRAWDAMTTGFGVDRSSSDAEKIVELFGGFLLAIRKDMGNPTTTLTKLDMVRTLVTDIDQEYAALQKDRTVKAIRK